MAAGAVSRVSYVCYGSNLLSARFLAYIVGGTVPGNSRVYHGARDKSPPAGASGLVAVPFPLRFQRVSHAWGGGGLAFIDVRERGSSWGRAYSISYEQFVDVVAQENGFKPGVAGLLTREQVEALRARGEGATLDVGTGTLYSHVVYLGDDAHGHPRLSFTCPPAEFDAWAHNAPSAAYYRVILSGLVEAGMPLHAAREYMRAAAGVAHDVDLLVAPHAPLSAVPAAPGAPATSAVASTAAAAAATAPATAAAPTPSARVVGGAAVAGATGAVVAGVSVLPTSGAAAMPGGAGSAAGCRQMDACVDAAPSSTSSGSGAGDHGLQVAAHPAVS